MNIRTEHRIRAAAAAAAVLLLLAACRGGRTERAYFVALGGVADRGEAHILEYDCGSCHTIPGVRGAEGVVGPPLMFFSRRTYIAGRLPNTPENLVHWISAPKTVDAETAMPDLGLSDQEARDVAAYLYTLR